MTFDLETFLFPQLLMTLGFFSIAYASDVKPLNDSILFAFDKCTQITVDLQKTVIEEPQKIPAFDMHCVNTQNDPLMFKCDFFEAVSNKKLGLEALSGGKTEKMGSLSNRGGTTIQFSLEKGTAAFDAPVEAKGGMRPGRKICAGIFIFEKEGLKKKK